MKKNIKDNVVYYTFDSFSDIDFIKHSFSTRIGGVSKGNLSSMNFAFKKENRDNVYKNFKILCDATNMSYDGILLIMQKHTSDVKCVSKENAGNIFSKEDSLGDIDGVITKDKNIVLSTLHADCTPLYFVDKVKKVIALSHAGWRGTVNGIAKNTVELMKKNYNSSYEDILVGIGPTIGFSCFVVDSDVKEEFVKKIPDLNKEEFIKPLKDDKNKYYIDISIANKNLLLDTGILEENIEVSNLCTKCNSDIFYSHRVMGFDRGCMVAMLELVGD